MCIKNSKEEKNRVSFSFSFLILAFFCLWAGAKEGQEDHVWKDPGLKRWLFWIHGDTQEDAGAVLSEISPSGQPYFYRNSRISNTLY